jgi:hypothetical protein
MFARHGNNTVLLYTKDITDIVWKNIESSQELPRSYRRPRDQVGIPNRSHDV